MGIGLPDSFVLKRESLCLVPGRPTPVKKSMTQLRFKSWLRTTRGRWTLAGLLSLLLAFVLGGHLLGLWRLQYLAGTARLGPEPRSFAVQRVSLNMLGIQGNRDSFAPSVSLDGRWIAFLSAADNLVPEDNNGVQDVFLFDRESGSIKRVSKGSGGVEANARSSEVVLSADGKVVAFVSLASNLVANDDNGVEDVFIYDRETEVVSRVSVSSGGEEGNERSLQVALSRYGRFVAFVSLADDLVEGDRNERSDVFVHDRQLGTTERVSVGQGQVEANGTSKYPAISADGRVVAYQSKADNLVSGDNNMMYDIFLYDRSAGMVTLISRALDGGVANMESQRPSLSMDGRYVAFESWANDLVAQDQNDYSDVFVFDRSSGVMEIVSVTSDGMQTNNVSGAPVISGDGRYVAFASLADNLSPDDNNAQFDVYLRERSQKRTSLISIGIDDQAGNGTSINATLAASGRYIVFDSLATNLVADDTNAFLDVFIFDSLANVNLSHTLNLPLLSG
jgi:Tol biopolymer transport system component